MDGQAEGPAKQKRVKVNRAHSTSALRTANTYIHTFYFTSPRGFSVKYVNKKINK